MLMYANMKQRKSTPSSQQPVQLDTFTLLHLRLYQFLGLCSVPLQLKCDLATVNQHPQRSSTHPTWWFLLIWHCLHFIFFGLLQFWTSTNHDSVLYNSDRFGKFNDILKLIATISAHFVILSETILQRKYMQKFLITYSQLHCRWSLGTYREEYGLYRTYVWKVIISTAVYLSIVVNYTQSIATRRQWLTFFLPFIPSGFICHFRSIEIMYFMDMLRIELEQLNKNVERLVLFSQRKFQTSAQRLDYFEQTICDELQTLMKNYEDIYEMSVLLKKAVGASIACNYVKEYVMILSECYWSYWMIYTGQDIIEYSLIVPSAMTIFLLLITSRNCMRSANFLAHNVHKIRHDLEDLNISTRLQSFTLQILHQRIIIDGIGFFVLNCNMARDVLGSIATYMLFFIQFMPKFKNI
ncbi:gustatory receptor 8a-like [Anastrepha ludens]|uniref:gustatory receptor 8a-like n=1 Tax=Anastrepha ludens TaxID=28586 RepID=UPI0023AF3743|nr:gustatory receptor 8a-like [Anastrepha ludens]XP_053949661.1 gustatory receptor 8a-like [Anastrepha ludens]XP_053949662.1 gustatory receptor 8a-like [Anastrepha ludens]